jgi:PTS system mannose-specific IIC component
VGFAILLRYLPVKKHTAFLLLGFAITALFGTAFANIGTLGGDVAALGTAAGLEGVPSGMYNSLSMLTIAVIGLAVSILYYNNNQARPAVAAAAQDGDDDDEL